MNESDFNALAERWINAVAAAFDDCGIDCEPELKADGVLDVEFPDGSHIVINRHTAAREIWVAAKSGGFHFRHDGEHWLDTRSGEELMAALSQLASAQGGERVNLVPRLR